MVLPLHVGNALRLHLQPPAGALRWRVLRRADANFAGPDQSDIDGALIVYEGNEPVFLDTAYLINGAQAFYQAFYFTTLAPAPFVASNIASGTPAATYEEKTDDPLSYIRERLELGLKVEVDRQTLTHELGYIPVFNAAPALEQDMRFPLVTVHLESDDAAERGIGETIGVDVFDAVGDMWEEAEGWLANVRITVIGWALNADARIALRRALKRLMIANLPVFAAKGWQQVEFGQQDIDSIDGEFPVPMFQVLGNFTCLAPVVVGGKVAPVHEVEVTANTF